MNNAIGGGNIEFTSSQNTKKKKKPWVNPSKNKIRKTIN
jgi:hypothetical protein